MDFEIERKKLVEYLSGFSIQSQEIKNAFLNVKRELVDSAEKMTMKLTLS